MIYAFKEYLLDADRRELRRGAALIAAEPQTFDLLLYLIRNRERVVSKDDLMAAVWSGRIVSESTLSSQITAVRHAIGDDGQTLALGQVERVLVVVALHPDVGVAGETDSHPVERERGAHRIEGTS